MIRSRPLNCRLLNSTYDSPKKIESKVGKFTFTIHLSLFTCHCSSVIVYLLLYIYIYIYSYSYKLGMDKIWYWQYTPCVMVCYIFTGNPSKNKSIFFPKQYHILQINNKILIDIDGRITIMFFLLLFFIIMKDHNNVVV